MAGEKEIACCVRGYYVYKDIWATAIWEVLVCSTEPTNVGKKFYIRVKYVFCVRKYFYNENKANYVTDVCIRESVDSLCRDGADMQYMNE